MPLGIAYPLIKNQLCPWILKQGGLKSSGRRLISLNSKTRRIVFFLFLFSSSKFTDFFNKSDFWDLLILFYLIFYFMTFLKDIYILFSRLLWLQLKTGGQEELKRYFLCPKGKKPRPRSKPSAGARSIKNSIKVNSGNMENIHLCNIFFCT